MAGHDDEDPGFWPGYVAAISGLVQGMLIMAMALGICIFGLGQLAQGPGVKVAGRVAAPGTRAMAGLPVASRRSGQDAGGAGPLPPGASGAAAEPPPLPPERPERSVNVAFGADAVTLPASAANEMAELAKSAGAGHAARFRLTLQTDLTDPHKRRAGYLRLLAIRAALIEAGVANEAIEVLLLNSEGAPADNPGVRIEQFAASPGGGSAP